MTVVLDWDGTVTERDTLQTVLERFLPRDVFETIAPVLAREGIPARVRANHAMPGPDGWRIAWTSDADCAVCGEPCKRGGVPEGPFVYVGDGYSDRCAALAASRIFARDRLAAYLDGRGVAYEPFTDFCDLAAALRDEGCPSTSSG